MQAKEIQAAQKFLANYGYVKRCALTAAPLPRFAEDIAQQVFIEFVSRSEQWDLDSDLRPILAKTTFFVAKKYWREHRKNLPPMLAKLAENLQLDEEASLAAASTQRNSHENDRENEIAALWKCLDLLPAKSRDLIHSYYFKHVKTDQLAQEMKVQTESVNRAICRIREKLRLCMQRNAVREGDHER